MRWEYRQRRWAGWVLLFLPTMLGSLCLASEGIQEKPYRIGLPGGVFVMQPAYPTHDSDILRSDDGKPYPGSGLYPVDGSVEALWRANWFADTVLRTHRLSPNVCPLTFRDLAYGTWKGFPRHPPRSPNPEARMLAVSSAEPSDPFPGS